ncbi:TetR/AcrR family transcriptional regulator [Paenibacillus sp. 481]|uniref:TetR/AcrR family transcriptional regulator n=1 Tax=Paenibacillus sp. 481 TaxID=2835869 RepID=UPI0022B46CC3|nr:TetR/AcrR family transcriptional regulator [Paenibacillus sp. 481]UHA72206.1 TetR/AcrR family transcriptional regulator [Paenibacillus sp. 481]
MRDRIRTAAIALLTERGLKFTTHELAARLGTSKRTIYQYYESKEQLISAIVDESIAEVIQTEQHIYNDSALTSVQKLYAVLSIVPQGLRLGDKRLLAEIKRYAPLEWEKINKLLQEEWGTVTAIVEAGIANGEFRPVHVQTIIQMMKGASAAIFDPEFLMHSSHTVTQNVAIMVDVLVHGLCKQTESKVDTCE